MPSEEKIITIQEVMQFCQETYKKSNYTGCIKVASEILQKDPHHIDAIYISALSYRNLKQYDQAIKMINKCLKINPNISDLHFELGNLAEYNNNTETAINSYKKALEIEPNNIPAMNNLANLLNTKGQHTQALKYFYKITKLNNNAAYIYNNIANTYKLMNSYQEAEIAISKALSIEKTTPTIFHNAAIIYATLRKRKEAIQHYQSAYSLAPNNPQIATEYQELLKKICAWEEYKKITNNNIHNLTPLNSIINNEDPSRNLEAAKRFTQQKTRQILQLHKPFKHKKPKNISHKLKIAYISYNIRMHPVAYLMRGIFKNHNKNNIEVYLYSSNEPDNSDYKQTIESNCNHVIDVSNISSHDIAKQIYKDKIDILIDLNGHTDNSWIEVLALKPAPIQVNYLGFIGSIGADFVDYIITDKIVTPPNQQINYSEKFVYMPTCYQANDDLLTIDPNPITRKNENLPENTFVFCMFNQAMKIDEEMFTIWMNILKQVDNSVLWLFGDSMYENDHLVENNLTKAAQQQNIDPKRLIFAKYAPLNKHLKRTSLADLALDTRHYNGGTVTSHTLWSGVPVLTLQGNHFASRMSSSILNAIGLNELVTTDIKDYEKLAIQIGNNPVMLKKLKNKLKENKKTHPLFNTKEFTTNLELAYKLMWENYCKGNTPQILQVNPKKSP